MTSSLFCMNCGYKNSYTLNKPSNCAKCNNSLGVFLGSTKTKPREENIKKNPIDKIKHKQSYDSFSEDGNEDKNEDEAPYKPPIEIEPLTKEEIESFTIANASRAFKLPNLIMESVKNYSSEPKKRGRPKKS